jgi:tripartite-type tricarboxylate transporter receptor subunit TctC
MQRRSFTLAATTALAALAAPGFAGASGDAATPTGPVKIVVGFAPGGGTDVLARVIGQKLGVMWNTTVIVENRAGATGVIAADYVTKQPPDGTTLLMAHVNSHAIAPALLQGVRYDPRKDFTPLTLVGVTPNMLTCRPEQKVRTLADIVALCRQRPGRVSFGSSGIGSAQHLAFEMFKLQAKVDAVHVPYKGSSALIVDLLGGQIDYAFDTMTAAARHQPGDGRAVCLHVAGRPGRGRHQDRTAQDRRPDPRLDGVQDEGPDSLGFLNMNRNKRSVVLDLKSAAGRSVLLRLVKEADILIENYRPGAMKKLGLGYEVLKDVNPRLVYTSISGFGQTGPWANRPGFDLMAQAMSGVMSVTGYPNSPPVKAGVPVADIGCALFAIYATLAAYIGAKSSGQGQHVDAALFDSAMAFSVWDTCDWWGTGKPPEPLGTANKMTAPYQAMACADGYFVMGANNQKLWVQLCQLMQREDLLSNPLFHHHRAAAGQPAGAAGRTGAHLQAEAQGLLGQHAAGQRHPGRPHPHLPRGVRQRARQGAQHAHGDRPPDRGQGAQHRLRGEAVGHAAAGAPPSAAAGRAHPRGAGRTGHRRGRARAPDGVGSVRVMNDGAVHLRIEGAHRVRHLRPPAGAQRHDLGDVRVAGRHLRAPEGRPPCAWCASAAPAARPSWPAPTSRSSSTSRRRRRRRLRKAHRRLRRPARVAAHAHGRRAGGLDHRRRPGHRHRLRLPHRHARHQARRADRAHAGQLTSTVRRLV